jgi:hypothetical protein
MILLGPTVDLVVEQGIDVPADQQDAPRGDGAAGNGQPRDFGSELKARLGLGRGAAPREPAPAPPKPALPVGKRRLSRTKLAQFKPERLRFGKQPGTKR